MAEYSLQTPEQVSAGLAARLRQLRLARGWLRRFESSGRASLQNLLRLAFALGRLDDFDAVFGAPVASSIAELEAAQERPARRRGRI